MEIFSYFHDQNLISSSRHVAKIKLLKSGAAWKAQISSNMVSWGHLSPSYKTAIKKYSKVNFAILERLYSVVDEI